MDYTATPFLIFRLLRSALPLDLDISLRRDIELANGEQNFGLELEGLYSVPNIQNNWIFDWPPSVHVGLTKS